MIAHRKEKKDTKSTGDKKEPHATASDTGSSRANKESDLILLRESLEKAKKERDEYVTLLQRERADFINFKKRIEEEKKEFITFGQSLLLAKWIPLYELLNKAVEHLPANLQADSWVQGVVQIKDLFDKLFHDLDIGKIETVGKPFDSSMHEAMMQIDGPEGIVMQEFEAGYLFHGRVIRPAKVSVGREPKKQEPTHETNIDLPVNKADTAERNAPPIDSIPTI